MFLDVTPTPVEHSAAAETTQKSTTWVPFHLDAAWLLSTLTHLSLIKATKKYQKSISSASTSTADIWYPIYFPDGFPRLTLWVYLDRMIQA